MYGFFSSIINSRQTRAGERGIYLRARQTDSEKRPRSHGELLSTQIFLINRQVADHVRSVLRREAAFSR